MIEIDEIIRMLTIPSRNNPLSTTLYQNKNKQQNKINTVYEELQ